MGLGGVSGEFQLFQDGGENAVGILQDVVVPEADYAVAVGFYHRGTRFVGGAVAVLAAVEFDGQPRRSASEIDHEVANRVLARKLEPIQLAGPQMRPEPSFRVGHIVAQLARYAGQSLPNQGYTPIPNPFPQGKGLC